MGRQDLEGNFAPELRIGRTVHLAHAAHAKGPDNLVMFEASVRSDGHGETDFSRSGARRPWRGRISSGRASDVYEGAKSEHTIACRKRPEQRRLIPELFDLLKPN